MHGDQLGHLLLVDVSSASFHDVHCRLLQSMLLRDGFLYASSHLLHRRDVYEWPLCLSLLFLKLSIHLSNHVSVCSENLLRILKSSIFAMPLEKLFAQLSLLGSGIVRYWASP